MRMERKRSVKRRKNPGAKKLPAILCALLLVLATALTAAANDEWIDLSRTGSVTVTLKNQSGQTLSGGSLTVYQVADVAVDDGNLSFAYTNGFEHCGIELGDLSDSTLAGKLENKLSASAAGTDASVGANGTVKFSDLKLGLYLVVQKEACTGYAPVSSFLVSVPMTEDGTYIYDVDASPKVSAPVSVTPTPTAPPVTPNLPYTGQLTWPVPVLTISGLLLFAFGWSLRRKKAA